MDGNGHPHIFTIGHSDHTIERFLELLRGHEVTALADVRSMPFSRYYPQFNREPLQACLRAAGLRYVFMGDELGARRAEAECYAGDVARYDLIARARLFQDGLRRVREGAGRERIALMCAEKDPITCHRAILVCRHLLRAGGLSIAHVLADGALESTERMEERLLDETGGGGADLFSTHADAVERAYDVQGERIAYTRNAVAADERG
jgi:uncharacterized protein (DUF488 family)